MIVHHLVKKPAELSEVLSQLDVDPIHQQELLEFGAIYCNGLRIRENIKLNSSDQLRIHLKPKRFLQLNAEWVPLKVFEDEDIIIIDKPGGLPTHPTLDNYLENAQMLCHKAWKIPIFVTHRLDVATSGLLIFAKTKGAQKGINKLLRKRRIEKIYRAQTDATVAEGSYLHFLNPLSKTPKEISDQNQEGWLDCRLQVKHLDRSGTCLEIDLETGRTHQIRAQLAFLGAPICGDQSYGSKIILEKDKKFIHERIALECYYLSFTLRSRTLGISRPSTLVAPHNI